MTNRDKINSMDNKTFAHMYCTGQGEQKCDIMNCYCMCTKYCKKHPQADTIPCEELITEWLSLEV